MPSISDEIREIAEYYKADAKRVFGYGRTFEEHIAKADHLLAIADRLEGKVLVNPEIDVDGFGTYLASVDEDGMHRHPYGTGLTLAAAIAALQAKLDKQESSSTPSE